MEQAFSFAANELTAAGFAALAVIFAFRGQYSLPKIVFSVALALTGVWAFVLGLSQGGYVKDWIPSTASALRDAGWFAAILVLLQHESEGASLWKRLGVTAG